MDKPNVAPSRWGRWARCGVLVLLVAMPASMVSQRALAMPPNPAPDGSVPGSELMTQILGWLKWIALWAAVAGILVGGTSVGVGHFGSNYGAASAGRKWLLGGMGAAVIAGLAWTFASTIYNSTS